MSEFETPPFDLDDAARDALGGSPGFDRQDWQPEDVEVVVPEEFQEPADRFPITEFYNYWSNT